MKWKIWIALLVTMTSAIADVPNPDFEFLINRLPGQPLARKYQLGTKIREAHNTAVCVYDFATSGGAIATSGITLLSSDLSTPCLIPGKSVIRGGYIDVASGITSPSGGTFSLFIKTPSVDILGTTVASGFIINRYAIKPTIATTTTYIKLATGSLVTNGLMTNFYPASMVISSNAITGGHFRLFLDYNLSD